MTTPVLTVDGPSGAGKGTLCRLLADTLGWHLLDSGALYRVLGYACQLEGVAWDDEPAVAQVARQLAVDFRLTDSGVAVELSGRDVTREVRSEEGGRGASAVAALPSVREALLARQRELARAPGLVADGRDMGTAVFPKADLKIFLTASAEARARRRQLQLQAQGDSVSLPRLLEAIQERDARDSSRSVSPLVAAEDAVTIDSTSLSIDEVLAAVLALAAERGLARRAD
ncbi:MAG: (d)CMP kinase [Halieaceae bacterium]|jgi:cytidylate kinase|nr:(d)CMP kinase [Halieaceae bacterium]